MNHDGDDTMAAAERLIDKIRAFVERLDDLERPLMAALLAPGIDAAWSDDAELEADTGFELGWTPQHLPAHLCDAVQRADVRISIQPR